LIINALLVDRGNVNIKKLNHLNNFQLIITPIIIIFISFYLCIDNSITLKRKFITNLGFLVFLNVIIKPLYVFGIDRVVQNNVGAEIYGSYFSLFNTALIFQIILDLGIENFIRREIAQYPALISRYLSNIVILKLILALPYALICFVVALIMNIRPQEIPLLLIILLNQFMASFILSMRANLGGLQFFKTEGIISILDRLIMILIVGYLLINPLTSGNFHIMWFVLAQTLAYAVTLTASFFLVLGKTVTFRFTINIKQLIPVIQKLKPYALLVLLMAVYYRIDSVLLRILLPDGDLQAGIFAHAFRILDFMSNYALLFPLLLLPIFSHHIRQNQRIDGLLQLSFLLLIVPSLAGIIPSIFYRREIFDLLYHEHSIISGDIYAFLSLSYIGMCVCYTFGALLTANGNLKQLNYMAACAVILSITLNLILIPTYKVYGAAIANATVQFFTIIIHIILAKRIFKLSANYRTILKLTGYVSILILISLLFRYLKIQWLASMIILTTFGLFTALLLDLISVKGLFSILKQKDLE